MHCNRTQGCVTAVVLLYCAISFPLLAQTQTVDSAREILKLTEAEQVQFVKATLDQGLPDNRADQMTMLVINRSSLTLPLIEVRIEEALKLPSPSPRFIATASELIAYA